ncbi:MAG: CoB--CoM heterodisulfide reductase iron-sulfur subunit A family protein [Anaerolineae bacterium]|nr:CoB--CoM heterodisulfide reductase iron-sulfur subunit A family protein [Anaerolineae bacterium]
MPNPEERAALVIGGGVGGMRAALDLAEVGIRVYLVESTPGLGGRVAQLGFMFPTHDCVLCRGTSDHGYGCTRPSISPAFLDHNRHPNITIFTNTLVVAVEGQAGDFRVMLSQEPRYVDPARCINCGECEKVCPVEIPSSFQAGLSTHKAIYKSAPRALPDAYVIEYGPYCEDCGRCARACPTHAIDLNQFFQTITLNVGAIILALGYQLFDAGNLEEFGHGRYPNVLHSMQYERLASRSGPTEGIVHRPSDGKIPKRIAWLQCIGSRDQENPFCSSICCMYATKQAILAKERLAEVGCSVFVMDERAFNKEYNSYYVQSREHYGVEYVRCRVSEVREDPATHDLILHYMDEMGQLRRERFDMVVLSVGTQPPAEAEAMARLLDIELNPSGFCRVDKFTPLQTSRPGVFVCGAFSTPKEIAETLIDASGAAAEVVRLLGFNPNNQVSHVLPFLDESDLPPEKDVNGQPPRVGVFLCSCGSCIGETVDLDAVADGAAHLPGVVYTERLRFACFPEGRHYLRRAIEQYGLNRVVVGACSGRTHESLFQRVVREVGLNPYLLELINLREHCAWVHQGQPELATRKAQTLVRRAVGRLRPARALHRQTLTPAAAALVIGGGVAGMTAALAIADSGYEVHLVERDDTLGGNLRHIYYVAEGDNPQQLLRDLVNRVLAHEHIHVHMRTELTAQTGHVGDFRSTLRTTHYGGFTTETSVRHGATIIATGGRETRNGYGLEDHPNVITQSDLEKLIAHNPQALEGVRSVVMIQCVRPPHLPDYCSRTCCTNTLKNAIRLKMLDENCQIIVLYKDIVTYGFREQYYTEARRRGVIFLRYTDARKPEIEPAGDRLKVRVADLSLGRPFEVMADRVVLSMSIEPAEGTARLARLLQVPLSPEGFFMEAHLKMRPMDFMQEGVFLCGMAHYPKFIEECISHALATAGRALQVLSQKSFHLGGVVAEVDPARCVGCLTCVRTCPFGIPEVRPDRPGVGDLGGSAYIDPSRCQGCGTCTAECPANAIQLLNYLDEQIMQL